MEHCLCGLQIHMFTAAGLQIQPNKLTIHEVDDVPALEDGKEGEGAK
ncbi:MAG: hypothetical protein J6W37_02835 [Bacteroidales bacterium]|nr:hypothetical protein [Bacteroidales bacterium]